MAPRPVTETYAPIAAPTSPSKYRQPTPAPYKEELVKPVKVGIVRKSEPSMTSSMANGENLKRRTVSSEN